MNPYLMSVAALVPRALNRSLDWLRSRREAPSAIIRRHWAWASPYVAEAGLSVFTAASSLTAVLICLELSFPGFASPYVPPQALVAVLFVSGIMAQGGAEGQGGTWRGRLVWAIIGLILAIAAFAVVRQAFASFAGGFWASLGAAAAVGVPCWAFGVKDDGIVKS